MEKILHHLNDCSAFRHVRQQLESILRETGRYRPDTGGYRPDGYFSLKILSSCCLTCLQSYSHSSGARFFPFTVPLLLLLLLLLDWHATRLDWPAAVVKTDNVHATFPTDTWLIPRAVGPTIATLSESDQVASGWLPGRGPRRLPP